MNNFSVSSQLLVPVFLASVLSGCNLQPTYQRPALPVTANWHEATSSGKNAADMHWSDFFTDPVLQRLIALSLENNRDLRVAALNVESAQAQYGLSRANLMPTVDVNLNKTAEHLPGNLYSTQTSGPVTYQQYEGNLAVSSWEMDFFGRLRSLRDEALENYLAYDATRQATQLSLIAEVAEAYITLCADADLYRLAIATAENQQNSLKLTSTRFQAGTVTEQDVLQAKTTFTSAQADIAKYDRQRRQDANALSLLLGTTLPDDVYQNATLSQRWVFPQLSSGLPSAVLLRRPDIMAAEHSLKAANANIGAARAAFFPTISLTASGGAASSSLGHLFEAGTAAWTFVPSISLPIFDGGKNRANLDVAKISKKIEVADYEKAIQQAFKEVSDALAGTETYAQELDSRQQDMDANQRYFMLAQQRYASGLDNYLDVLTAQRSYYSARQSYIDVLSDSLSQKISLYKVLGGGWQ